MDTGRFGGRGAIGLGVVIVAIALGLRALGLAHGLPIVAPGEDWPHVFSLLNGAIGPQVLEPAARGAHFALLQLEYLTAYWTWQLGGAVADYEEFGVRMVEDPTRFWTVARAGVALLGAATVLILFRHGRRVGGGAAGALAALFLAVAIRHVEVSRRVAPECALALFSFWALTLIVEARSQEREVPSWRFPLIAGAAARAGWPGILLLVPYLGAAISRFGLRGAVSPKTLRPAVFAASLAAVTALRSWTVGDGGAGGGPAVTDAGSWAAWVDAGRALVGSTGPALLLLAVIGAGMSMRSGRPSHVLHVQYVLAVAVGLLAGWIDRASAVAALPSICLLGAQALVDLVEEVRGQRRAPVAAVVALGVLVGLEPAIGSWDLVRRDRAADTRLLAARWVEANVPDRQAVVVPVDTEAPWRSQVPLPDLKRNMKQRAVTVQQEDPRGAPYWDAAIRANRPRRYDLRLVDGGVAVGLPSAREPREPATFAIVDSSDTTWSGETVAIFRPVWPTTKGPALEIRQLVPDATPAAPDEETDG